MEDKDVNQEALEQVQRITESEPISGEDLLGSEELKRKLREAKKREAKSDDDASSSQDAS